MQAVLQHQPDAVVLDVQMPRVSGFIAARLLKDDWQTADIPVVMLTSLDAASDRYWAGQAGVDRYLTKDFEAPELAGTIEEVLLSARRRAADGPGSLRTWWTCPRRTCSRASATSSTASSSSPPWRSR